MYEKIIEILKYLNIDYEEKSHPESTSCEHSKKLRDNIGFEGLGSKNIVFHCEGMFYIVVTHADKRINAKRFKKEFSSKNIRFATQEEITEHVGGTIGCIPSFGYNNNEVPIYVDSEIFTHEYFMFNPNDPTKSIRLKTGDLNYLYTQLENPVKFFIGGVETMEIIEEEVITE